MAAPQFTQKANAKGVCQVTWSGLTFPMSGIPWSIGAFQSFTFQLAGTLGAGGSVNIEGSMDNSSWGLCHLPGGTTAVLTALGLAAIVETPLYLRPNVTAGDGTTNLTVNLLAVANVG